jgi:mono/diheme cytochrome c family protein
VSNVLPAERPQSAEANILAGIPNAKGEIEWDMLGFEDQQVATSAAYVMQAATQMNQADRAKLLEMINEARGE